jgi:biopolymer transport protein TolR
MTISVEANGKRSLQAELNLVPFIDFLSVLISFLLVSAVWTQLSRINVATAHEPGAETSLVAASNSPLVVTIQDSGFVIESGPLEKAQIAKRGGQLQMEGLFSQLQSLKSQNAERSQVKVLASAGVSYEQAIRVVDLCIKAGFPEVDLGPAK